MYRQITANIPVTNVAFTSHRHLLSCLSDFMLEKNEEGLWKIQQARHEPHEHYYYGVYVLCHHETAIINQVLVKSSVYSLKRKTAFHRLWLESYLVPPRLWGRTDPLLGVRRRERLGRNVQHVVNASEAAPVSQKTYVTKWRLITMTYVRRFCRRNGC